MSRLYMEAPDRAQVVVEGLYKDIERRVIASPPGTCPVDVASAFIKLCHSQTCGKCIPCRVGLGQLENLLESVLDGEASTETLNLIRRTAKVIYETADCAIGYEAAKMVLKGLEGFADDYKSHVEKHRCADTSFVPVPCVSLCPANVDVPGYIACIAAGRYGDAIRVIRKDNPFPVACAYICEHPCEAHCRRAIMDDAINIRGLKKYAADHAGKVPVPERAESTGKKVAVIGGGPSGLSAAYYLALMGHQVTVFEQRDQLGGMMRYGIPSYRFPRETMEAEIDDILSLGIEVKTGVSIGKDVPFKDLKEGFDAVFISIGAHTDKKLRIEGEDSQGVISAVDMLRGIGDKTFPDFKGKRVVIVGGGNVAMDVTRTSKRLGAAKVTCVYRRRQADMTALPEEVEGAIAEGCELLTMKAPDHVETDEAGNVTALWVQPQIVGPIRDGRPSPVKANAPAERIPADIIIVAIGQSIDSGHFAEEGLPVKWENLMADSSTSIGDVPGIFAGGDCVTGPATVIKAIAAGKVAAANIDEYLGFNHEIKLNVEIPPVILGSQPPYGRVAIAEREASERQNDFEGIEGGMSADEALQEALRCLRCDHFGYGSFRGGRVRSW